MSRTTTADKAAPYPVDKVNRPFRAVQPNGLWVSFSTYVATWQRFVDVAFTIDVFARRVVGWRVLRTTQANIVLDARQQALHDRRLAKGGLIPRSDSGSRYVAVRSSEHLLEAGSKPSVGSVSDSDDDTLAKTRIACIQQRAKTLRQP